MLKLKPQDDYPVESGRFLRGNDYSPAAVCIILNTDEDKIHPDIEALVKSGYEAGSALSGTVQTPNVGFEKMISNIIANPNIRYLILGGPESGGHHTGEALKKLFNNGVDDKKRIIGTDALYPFLYNLSVECIERFRKQITLIDLQFKADPALIKKAVWSCYQENPVDFEGYNLFDPGAYPEPLINSKISWNNKEPWIEPVDDKQKEAIKKAKELIEKLKSMSLKKDKE